MYNHDNGPIENGQPSLITVASKIVFIRVIKNPLYLLINKINLSSFKYTVRIIAKCIIAFVDRSLLLFAYNHANYSKKNFTQSRGGGSNFVVHQNDCGEKIAAATVTFQRGD